MERFVKPVSDGGVPYLNKDIYGILQQNNLISYKSILDEMNDSTDPNNGIILTGVKDVTTYLEDEITQDIRFDFTNSLIYLDGDFLEPVPFLATQSNYETGSKFYLTVFSEKEQRLFKVTDELTDIVETKYFDYSISKPGGPYIEIEIDSTRLPQINLCTRYLSRIYRYYTSQKDQIFMTYDIKNFIGGKGVGDMHGFALCDGRNRTKNLSGEFLIGFDKNSNVSPENFSGLSSTGLIKNYGKLGNLGGSINVTLAESNLPTHNHGGDTDVPNNNLYHNHEIPTGTFNEYAVGGTGILFARVSKFENSTLVYFGPQKKYRTSGEGDVYQTPQIDDLYEPISESSWSWDTYYSGRNPTSELDNHTHKIDTDIGGGQPHNNLPPYVVISYYQKI